MATAVTPTLSDKRKIVSISRSKIILNAHPIAYIRQFSKVRDPFRKPLFFLEFLELMRKNCINFRFRFFRHFAEVIVVIDSLIQKLKRPRFLFDLHLVLSSVPINAFYLFNHINQPY